MTVTAGLDAENVAPLVDDFARLLGGQPLWAIDAACLAILRSGAKFRPTAPEILDRATREAAPARAELADITIVLDADIYRAPDPTERKRVLARFKEMIAECGLCQPLDHKQGPQTRSEARQAVAEGFAHLRGPLSVSTELAASNALHKRALARTEAA